jgi:hypothetical protein
MIIAKRFSPLIHKEEAAMIRHSPHYIGITDFMTADQVRIMTEVFPKSSDWNRQLGVGVMMSRKTHLGIPSRWANAFPQNEDVASIFLDAPSVFNILHYADYEDLTKQSELEDVLRLGGLNLHALQLDMIWPDPEMVHRAIAAHGHQHRRLVDIILQVGANAFTLAGNTPVCVVNRLAAYDSAGILKYVLLDRSMGQGRAMDAGSLIPFIDAIRTAYPKTRIVVAGGLGPDTIGLVQPIVRKYPGEISIDAQGRLRQSHSALDPIDWSMAEEYLRKAIVLFNKEEEY